jgi:hypothetical protein
VGLGHRPPPAPPLAGPLVFGETAPDAVRFPAGEGVVQAGHSDRAVGADGLRGGFPVSPRQAPLAVGRKEQLDVAVPARGLVLPAVPPGPRVLECGVQEILFRAEKVRYM